MNNFIRITSLALAALTLAGLLVSCSTSETQGEAGTTAASAAAAAAVTETTALTDSLPEKNFNGKNFNVLIRTEWAYEFKVTEQTGDVVNDAVLARNRAVEERFNAKLNFIDIKGSWNENVSFTNTIKNSILAGDGSHDMIASYQAYLVPLAVDGMFYNINDIPYIDFEKPWWSKQANDSLTLDGCLYLATGDLALTFWENLYVMLYNKALAEKYKIEDLNKLVTDGGWTIDKLTALASGVSADINGDGKFGDEDLYGLATLKGNFLRAYLVTLKCPITVMGKDGYPELAINCEHTLQAVDKIAKLFFADSTYRDNKALKEPIPDGIPVVFAEDRALFMHAYLGNVGLLRDMDTDFGILPRPKFDEKQDAYYTTMHNSVSMVCFPITVKDTELSGILTEALCAESYDTVKPAIYNTALKTKYARDGESEAMIDLIRDSIIFDFGWVHSVNMDSIGTIFENIMTDANPNFASYYASKEKVYEEGLAKIIAAYKKAKGE